jgi:DNA-damage-inducible protein J
MYLYLNNEVISMSDTTNLSIRIDRNLKEEADKIFNDLGMNLTTAITVFIRQAVRQRKIPFELTLGENESARKITMAEAVAATERIWQASIKNGTDKMTLAEIEAEI